MKRPKLKIKKGRRYNVLFLRAPKDTTAADMARVFDHLLYSGLDVHVRMPLPKLQPIKEDDDTWRLTCLGKDEKKVIRILTGRFALEIARIEQDTLEIYVAKEEELPYDDSCK